MLKTQKYILFSILFIIFILASFRPKQNQELSFPQITITDSTTVWSIFEKLGKIRLHAIDKSIDGVDAQKGKELVHKGYTKDAKGRKTKKQSRFYVCTSCHNVEKEFEDLAENSPQARLEYAKANQLPFLQGSSLYGIVNRKNFYNDDYQKKYGGVPDIKAAHNSLRKAIHVCATQCSQGRAFEDWEMESVLAYLWTLQLKIGDLNLDQEALKIIEDAVNTRKNSSEAIHTLEDHYIDAYPAHFVDPPEYHTLKKIVADDKKRIANGKLVYELSCKFCHEGKRYSFFQLDDNLLTFKHLNKKMQQGHPHSLYKITRHGTYPLKGRRAYMPQYSSEKLSKNQLEDLRIYIEAQAEGRYQVDIGQ